MVANTLWKREEKSQTCQKPRVYTSRSGLTSVLESSGFHFTRFFLTVCDIIESTYFCSRAVWRCHSNPVCSSGRPGLRCGAGRADTGRSGSRRSLGPTCRCCCYTDRAGTARPPLRGFHSNQGSTRHSGRLSGQDCELLMQRSGINCSQSFPGRAGGLNPGESL